MVLGITYMSTYTLAFIPQWAFKPLRSRWAIWATAALKYFPRKFLFPFDIAYQ